LTNRTLDTPDTPLLPPEHFSFSITLDNLYSRNLSIVRWPVLCYSLDVFFHNTYHWLTTSGGLSLIALWFFPPGVKFFRPP